MARPHHSDAWENMYKKREQELSGRTVSNPGDTLRKMYEKLVAPRLAKRGECVPLPGTEGHQAEDDKSKGKLRRAKQKKAKKDKKEKAKKAKKALKKRKRKRKSASSSTDSSSEDSSVGAEVVDVAPVKTDSAHDTREAPTSKSQVAATFVVDSGSEA